MSMKLDIPIRCWCGNVVGTTEKIELFEDLQKKQVPMHEILKALGFDIKYDQCCRNIFMSTPILNENLNHV